jgi:hypothetical protein
MDIRKRFERGYMPVTESGCWIWIRRTDRYGTIFHNGKSRKAHRVAYELYRGPIPNGMSIDHLCRVTCCVNPDHLEAIPLRENILRGSNPPATNHKKTHCKRGHFLSGNNLYVKPAGERVCKTCRRLTRSKKWKEMHAQRALSTRG